MDENQGQAQMQAGLTNFVETMRRRRDEHIAMAERITRILDFLETHPDGREFLKLFDELNSPLA